MSDSHTDCPECSGRMTQVYKATEALELILRGYYCYDCRTWKDPDFTVDRDGEKHLLNGH